MVDAGLGGLQPPPINAPAGSEQPVGVQPGSVNVLRVRVLIVTGGAGSGVFVYSPSPGPGNLVASLTAIGGTDPFGNAYGAGLNIGNQSGGAHFGVAPNGNVFISNAAGQNLIQIRPSLAAELLYDGTPALGNLIVAMAAASGVDPQGNAFTKGVQVTSPALFKVVGSGGQIIEIAVASGTPALFLITNAASESGQATTFASVFNALAVNEFIAETIGGPISTGQGDHVNVILNSAAADASFNAGGSFQYGNGSTTIVPLSWGSSGLIGYGLILGKNPATGTFATPATAEVLHFVGGANSLGTTFGVAWGNAGGGFANLAFWITAEGELAIEGTITTTGTSPNNNVFTLPNASYIPATSRRIGVVTAAASPGSTANLQVASGTGVVQISNAVGGVATTIGISARFRLSL